MEGTKEQYLTGSSSANSTRSPVEIGTGVGDDTLASARAESDPVSPNQCLNQNDIDGGVFDKPGSSSNAGKTSPSEPSCTDPDSNEISSGTDSLDDEISSQGMDSPPKPAARPTLRRTSSSLPLRLVSLPKVNCREKLILCIDHSDEMFCNKFTSHSSSVNTVFTTLTSALRQFVNTKSFLNRNNEFSLILLNEGTQFITDYNRNPEELLTMLNDIASMPSTNTQQETDVDKIFDLSSMFNMILEQCGLRESSKQFVRIAPSYIVRVVFVFGRSNTRLVFSSGHASFNTLIKYPQFFLDCVHIHEPPHENNNVESTFSSICDLDVGGSSHIYEVGTDKNMACLFNIFAKLLAHPLQRPKQCDNSINYELKPDAVR